MNARPPVTTHILDLVSGRPAAGIPVTLYQDRESQQLASSVTNTDGRVEHWDQTFTLSPGRYRLEFDVEHYYVESGFYADIHIAFRVASTAEHYHVPLLLSRFGYSTYRGS